MKIKSITLDSNEAEKNRQETEHVHIASNFGFMMSHYGPRPKAMHVLLAPSHAGKTTFTLSFLVGVLKHQHNATKNLKIFCYWSEETVDNIASHLSQMGAVGNKIASVDNVSELDDSEYLELRLFEYLETVKPDLFIFDNVTTSKFYNDMQSRKQAEFLMRLKKVIKENNIALFIVAHTDRNVNMNLDRMICKEDVRGSKNLPNLAEFFYILQPIQTERHKLVYLIIDKHRGYDIENKYWLLNYNKMVRTVTSDLAVTFNNFKENFNSRNTLKGKSKNGI